MARTHRSSNPEGGKYFIHNNASFYNDEPNKVKKNGAGKNNWGQEEDILFDLIDQGEIPQVISKRRGSNAMKQEIKFQEIMNKY